MPAAAAATVASPCFTSSSSRARARPSSRLRRPASATRCRADGACILTRRASKPPDPGRQPAGEQGQGRSAAMPARAHGRGPRLPRLPRRPRSSPHGLVARRTREHRPGRERVSPRAEPRRTETRPGDAARALSPDRMARPRPAAAPPSGRLPRRFPLLRAPYGALPRGRRRRATWSRPALAPPRPACSRAANGSGARRKPRTTTACSPLVRGLAPSSSSRSSMWPSASAGAASSSSSTAAGSSASAGEACRTVSRVRASR